MITPGNPRFRVIYVIWAFLECTGYGGLMLGWGSLVYVLKDEGLYSDVCDSTAQNTSSHNIIRSTNDSDQQLAVGCKEQDTKLASIFTIATSFTGVSSFVIGQINFKFGTRISRVLASILYITGAFLIAFTSQEVQWIIFPGLAFIGAGGIMYLATTIQIANLFPVGGAAVVGLLCGGFDTSAGIQLMVKFGYENGITRQTSYLIIACTHFLTFVSTFCFLPRGFIPRPGPGIITYETNGANIEKDTTIEKKDTEKSVEFERPEEGTGNIRSLLHHMLTPTYLLHVFWQVVLQLRFYFSLGSINITLEKLLDTKVQVSHYTDVLLYVMMGGIVVSPLAGLMYTHQRKLFEKSRTTFKRQMMPTVIPLALTTTLCVAMSALVLVEDSSVLYAMFILLVFFRSFLYAISVGYITSIFQSAFLGSMFGVMILTGGIVSFLQYALFEWADSAGLKQVNVFLLVLSCVTYIHPGYQWLACVRAERRRDN
ncbi:unnamed protein product [Lymnaea stagnalis]|uniref:Solute carrier family 43 member 3 n=1 Tax=Lymnaea stagnalis TaxID=6523 RepID=A0AAV2I0X6_LYMST